jgi:hypothetical protein
MGVINCLITMLAGGLRAASAKRDHAIMRSGMWGHPRASRSQSGEHVDIERECPCGTRSACRGSIPASLIEAGVRSTGKGCVLARQLALASNAFARRQSLPTSRLVA